MQVYSLEDLNKSDKLKVLFLKGTLKQKLFENYITELNIKEAKLNIIIDIIFAINLFVVFFFTNEITIITCTIILLLNIYAMFFKKRIAIYLLKDFKNQLAFQFISLEKEYVKISMEEEFLNHNKVDYLKTFTLKEIVELSKEEFFKKEQYNLKYALKRENINIPELQDILKSQDYLEYILLGKQDKEIYNFVYELYKIDQQSVKNYIRENYKSELILNNKEKIKEVLNKEKENYSYELIVLNKN